VVVQPSARVAHPHVGMVNGIRANTLEAYVSETVVFGFSAK